MLAWLMVLVIVQPDGSPNLIIGRFPTEFSCNAHAEAIRETRPSLKHVIKCLDINKMLGVHV